MDFSSLTGEDLGKSFLMGGGASPAMQMMNLAKLSQAKKKPQEQEVLPAQSPINPQLLQQAYGRM